jgi:hypothetical protein
MDEQELEVLWLVTKQFKAELHLFVDALIEKYVAAAPPQHAAEVRKWFEEEVNEYALHRGES